jgi:predicted ATPase/class 3 adenylate cyclase
MRSALLSGTITFLFTDIEGSTKLWELHPEAMKAALAKHDSILRELIETNRGHIIKTTGDGVHAGFPTALDAVTATLSAQHKLQEPLGDLQIKVRMGLHTGEAEWREGDYYGQALNRAARLMSIAHGGQILVSNTTAELVYERLPSDTALRDLGEHRLKDLIRPEHVFQLTHPSITDEFPPIQSLDSFPNNLPIQLTSFIGRERELADASTRLSTTRLLTLIGSGGTGKTRLSLQLSADLLSTFTNGVWFVELAPLAEPSLVLRTVASIFGLREQMGMSLPDLVVDHLRTKHLVLILDNCEHLIDACAQVADQFLHACPNLKIIATSREALGIYGETVYRVPSLSLPDPDQVTPDALTRSEAGQLFVARMIASNPNFTLTEKNAAFVVQICRRLDGIPLALELAAARITVFSPEQIASRLGDRFKLLTGGSRTALPRQQTLRALIDWSYDLLNESERTLLRRLSVFAGGWTYDAAEAISPDLEVLDLLSHLVNKSLVAADDAGQETRYQLLETIRQYARDKLLEAGESKQIRNHQLNYFLKFAEAAEPKIYGPDALEWLLRLESEHDNFRTALEWGMENDVEAALRLVSALQPYWIGRGHEVEGVRWANQALARWETLSHPEGGDVGPQKIILANAWIALAILMLNLGDNAHLILACEKCLTFARPLDAKRLIAMALIFETAGKLFSGDTESASATAEEILAVARESGDIYVIGLALVVSGEVKAVNKHDFRGGHSDVLEGIALLTKSGNRWGLSIGVVGLGITAKFLDDYSEARSQFETCLPIFREIGDQHRVNVCRSELAHIERAEGHYEKAASMYRETILAWQKLGNRAAIAHQLECFGFIARVSEQDQRAARLFGAAKALREYINIPMSSVERIEHEREIADLHKHTADPSLDKSWEEGEAMSMDQAIAYALHIEGEPCS